MAENEQEQQGYLLDQLLPGQPIQGITDFMGNLWGGIKDWATRQPDPRTSNFLMNPSLEGTVPTMAGPFPQSMMPTPEPPGPSYEEQMQNLSPADQAALEYLNQWGDPGGSGGGPGLYGPIIEEDLPPPPGIEQGKFIPDPETNPSAPVPSVPTPNIHPGEEDVQQPQTQESTITPTSQILQMDQKQPVDLSQVFNIPKGEMPIYEPTKKTSDIDYEKEVERINKILPERLEDIKPRPKDVGHGKDVWRLMLEGAVIRLAGYSPLEVWEMYNKKAQAEWQQDVDYALKRLDVRRDAEWKILNYKMEKQNQERNASLKKAEMILNANPSVAENPAIWEDIAWGTGMSAEDARDWAIKNKDPVTGRWNLYISPEQRFLNQKTGEMKILQMIWPEASMKDLAAAAFFQDSKGIMADFRTKQVKKIEDLVAQGAPESVITNERNKLLQLDEALKKSGTEEVLDVVKTLTRIPGLKEMMGEEEFSRVLTAAVAQAAGVKGYQPAQGMTAKQALDYAKAQQKAPSIYQSALTQMYPEAALNKDLMSVKIQEVDNMVSREATEKKLPKEYAETKDKYIKSVISSMQSDGTPRGQVMAGLLTGLRNVLLQKGVDVKLEDVRQIMSWYDSGVDTEVAGRLVVDKIFPKYGIKSEAESKAAPGAQPQKQSEQQPPPKAPEGEAAIPNKYRDTVLQAAQQHKIEPALLAALIEVESNWDPGAVSKKGAMGLTQLMPGTAREVGVGEPFDVVENIMGGARYLRNMLDKAKGDIRRALEFYNMGPNYASPIIPYETRKYVDKVLAAMNKYLPRVAPGVL